MQFLLGILVGVVSSTVGHLLMSGTKPSWATVGSLRRRAVPSSIRRRIEVLQARLDRIDRFTASDRDLYLYLFQWFFALVASCVAAAACFLVVRSRIIDSQGPLLMAGLILLALAVTCCLAMVWSCRDFTTAGMQKTAVILQRDIANLTAKLPASERSEEEQSVRKAQPLGPRVEVPRAPLLALIPAPGKTVDVTDHIVQTEKGLTLETFAAEMKAAATQRLPATSKP